MLLIINSAESRLQMALAESEKTGWSLRACQEWQVQRTISYGAPGLKHLLDSLDKTPSDLSHIACVLGPGGFTGLRLSLSLAEGIAVAGGQKLAGLEYLSLLARPVTSSLPGTTFVVTHSRRRQVYFQAFTAGAHAPVSLCAPADAKLDTLSGLMAEALRNAPSDHPVQLLGSGLRRNADFFAPLAEERGWNILPALWDTPRPDTLVEAASDASYGNGPLAPLYLRGSDAEENLEQIAQKRGLDVTHARQLITRGSSVE